jgi:PST family polysaccharide transporter
MAPFAIRSTLSVTVAGAIGIAMALKGFGVWSLVAYEIARPLVAAVVLWGALEWRPQARLAVTHVAEAVRFCSRVLGERLIALTETLVPRAAIGVASSADAVGQWTLARKIFDLSTELVQRPALRVALPRFAGVQQQPGQLSRLLTSAVELTALVAIPGYAILGVLGADLVALSFGESWRTGGQVLMILALLGLITPVTQLSVAVLHAVGRVKLTLKLAVASFAVLVLLLIPGLRWGVFGVAVAFLVRGWAMLFVRLWAIRRTTGVKLSTSGGGFWPLLAAGLAMALVLFLAHTLLVSRLHPLAAMLAALALGVAIYSLLLLLLARDRIAAAIALVRDAVRPSAKAEH